MKDLNSHVAVKEIETSMNSIPTKKNSGLNDFHWRSLPNI